MKPIGLLSCALVLLTTFGCQARQNEPVQSQAGIAPGNSHALPRHALIGYLHNFDNGTGVLPVGQVDDSWDVIVLAFADDMGEGKVAFNPDPALERTQLIADIAAKRAQGKIVALSFGGKGSTGAPAIVKADNQPIKVKPENPGGTVIPNQDNKVYDMVAKGPKPAAPAQQQLVTQTEEPVDVTAQEPPSRVVDLSGQDGAEPQAAAQAPTAKAEDRIEQMAQDGAETVNAEVPVVTPRKVRTMVVKPDGSLVPREDPAPAQVAAAEPLDPAPQHVAAPGKPEATGTVAAPDDTAAIQGSEAPAAKPAAKTQSPMPAVAPIAPQRPSDQPVNVVGEVKPDQVASIDSGAAAVGTWSMQIASQPTEESAQSTYQDLARRYSGVLQGHTANIVKAEVAGKGTFYRVRVPAKSRNEAIALCTSYKAAGGNCFVSK